MLCIIYVSLSIFRLSGVLVDELTAFMHYVLLLVDANQSGVNKPPLLVFKLHS